MMCGECLKKIHYIRISNAYNMLHCLSFKGIALSFLTLVLAGTGCSRRSGRIDVIFDTDANNEIDDQHAIAYLLLNDETFNVLGLTTNTTTYGGDIASQSLEARRVARLVGREDVPVLDGADGSFEEILPHIGEPAFDGSAAVDFILVQARKHSAKRPLTLLAVGKLTNVALALAKDPSVASRMRLVWLGTRYPDAREYNLVNDIPAANYVLGSSIPMEVAPTASGGEPIGTESVRVARAYALAHFAGLGPRVQEPVEGLHGGAFSCFGDYSADLFAHVKEEKRSLYDLTAVAIVKNPAFGRPRTIPAPLIQDEKCVDCPDGVRPILLWEHFDRDGIIADFEATLRGKTDPSVAGCLEAWRSLSLHSDTDRVQLGRQVAANPGQWQAVYDFLKDNDLATLALGRHEIVPGGAYANVQEYQTKLENVFEAHRDYIDVQILVSGEEVIDVADLADALDCTMEYDKERDCVLYASAAKVRSLDADPSAWFVFFPSDLHRPGMAKDATPSPVRKVVAKIPVAE